MTLLSKLASEQGLQEADEKMAEKGETLGGNLGASDEGRNIDNNTIEDSHLHDQQAGSAADESDNSGEESDDNEETEELNSPASKNGGRDDDEADEGDESSSSKDDDSRNDESDSDDDDDNSNSEDEDDNNTTETAVGGGTVDESEKEGLSEYEIKRLERIKRNKARLIQLGLESKDGGGVLGKKKPQPKRRRKTAVNISESPSAPSRRSRRSSAGNVVSYAEPPMSISAAAAQVAAVPGEETQKLNEGRRKEKDRKYSKPRFIYEELQSIASHKRETLKQAEKLKRRCEKELSVLQKMAKSEEKKAERERQLQEKKAEIEKQMQQLEEEKQIFGTSCKDFVRGLERRKSEIISNVARYDGVQMGVWELIEAEERRAQNENKLKLLDAMDAYPKGMKDAVNTLNSFLLERAPKDPQPPRRSQRKATEGGEQTEGDEDPPKKKRQENETYTTQILSGQAAMNASSEATSNAASRASLSQAEHLMESRDNENPLEKSSSNSKRKREVNVGGWISPHFAASLDRSWLEKDVAQTSMDPKRFIPQPGDTVLYYPEGHRDFLKKYPDHLSGQKVTRMPLWERAKKERAKKEHTKTAETTSPMVDPETISKQENPAQAKTWWNEEWLSSIESSSLSRYPIICRVEKTQAEFPPDPYRKHKTKEGGKILWKVPGDVSKSNAEKKAPLRLAVTLRPLTSVMPPKWTQSGPADDSSLAPPPLFTAVTFPSSLQPFLIPFVWAYLENHSLSPGDDVVISQAAKKGKVREFSTIEGCFGSFRLDDKLSFIADVVTDLKECGDKQDIATDYVLGARIRSTNTRAISPQDAFVLAEFLSTLPTAISQSENVHATHINSVDFIRSTLPLWNGVSVLHDVYDRRTYSTQCWDLRQRKAQEKKDTSCSTFLDEFMEAGVLRTLDNVLRLKIECSIEDFLRENEQLEIFRSPITEDIAPAYGCAVPIPMCMERILMRLKNLGSSQANETKCYYRTFEAIIGDINVIQDNCTLYNDPSSDLVRAANEVLPAVKKFLTNVACRHVKEKTEKINAEHEKRDFVLLHCNSSALLESDGLPAGKTEGNKLSQDMIYDPFKKPFEVPLYRDWVQLTHPDASWQRDQARTQHSFPQWVPQGGDTVLYSRSLHAQFVKGHLESLNTDQCVLPQFQRDEGARECRIAENQWENSTSNEINDQLSEALESGWIAGTVVWIRAVFPRPPNSSHNKPEENKEGQFATDAPLLAVGLRFPGYELAHKKKPVVVYWRPCLFTFDLERPEELTSLCCKSCGVPEQTSFLRPDWADPNDNCDNVLKPDATVPASRKGPLGLPQQEAVAIESCLNLLKRRCLSQIPPDYVDTNLSCESVKHGYVPHVVKVGTKSLPDFTEILKLDFEDNKNSKSITTRGIRKEPDATLRQLEEVCFLPPWLSQSPIANGLEQDTEGTLLHEKLSPCPRLCLELVLIRLKNGYYRQKSAIQNDLIEAYVTSVLLFLAPSATTKKNDVSIKKIATALASNKYTVSSSDGSSSSRTLVAVEPSFATSSALQVNLNSSKKGSGKPTNTLRGHGGPKKLNRVSGNKASKDPGMPSKKVEAAGKSASAHSKKRKRRGRCGDCEACLSPDCGKCQFCLDKTKFGGKNTLKKPCVHRECPYKGFADKESIPGEIAHVSSTDPKLIKGQKRKRDSDANSSNDNASKRPGTEVEAAWRTPSGHSMLAADLKALDSGTSKKQSSAKNQGRGPVLNDEEIALLSKVEKVRRLYATAMVCIAETSHVQHLLGLKPLQVTGQKHLPSMSPQQAEAAMARETLVQLLSALDRDKCLNRFPLKPGRAPTMKVTLKCGGETIKSEVSAPSNTEHATSAEQVTDSKEGAKETKPPVSVPYRSENNAIQGRVPAPVNSEHATSAVHDTDSKEGPKESKHVSHSSVPQDCQTNAIQDGVVFNRNDYENDPSLIRLFFGRQGRLFPCLRCQANKQSMLYCRVQKAHSSVDFNLVWTFKDIGGLDGLFNMLFERPKPPALPPAANNNNQGEHGPRSLGENDGGECNAERTDTADAIDSQPAVPSAVVGSVTNVDVDKQVKEPQLAHPSATTSSPINTHGNMGAEEKMEIKKMEEGNKKEDKKEEDARKDPRELYQEAKDAHQLAEEILASAKTFAEAPARLSDEFISCNFPFDRDDGHYAFCIICGLSGDLLCCESCPNVAHPSPNCANINGIPEGDWFCSVECYKKKSDHKHQLRRDEAPPTTGAKAESSIEKSGTQEKASESKTGTLESTCNAEACIGGSRGEQGNTMETSLRTHGATGKGAAKNFEGNGNELDESSWKKTDRNASVPPTISKLPPVISFDEKKVEKLKGVLDELKIHRTGRRPGTQKKPKLGTVSSQELTKTEDQVSAVGDTQKPQEIGLGTKFMKSFGRYGFFEGVIVSEPTEEHPFYRVKYEDDDEEDLEKSEILDYIEKWAHKLGKRRRKKAKQHIASLKSEEGGPPQVEKETTLQQGNPEAQGTREPPREPTSQQGTPGVEGTGEPSTDLTLQKEIPGVQVTEGPAKEPTSQLESLAGPLEDSWPQQESTQKKGRGRPRKPTTIDISGFKSVARPDQLQDDVQPQISVHGMLPLGSVDKNPVVRPRKRPAEALPPSFPESGGAQPLSKISKVIDVETAGELSPVTTKPKEGYDSKQNKAAGKDGKVRSTTEAAGSNSGITQRRQHTDGFVESKHSSPKILSSRRSCD